MDPRHYFCGPAMVITNRLAGDSSVDGSVWHGNASGRESVSGRGGIGTRLEGAAGPSRRQGGIVARIAQAHERLTNRMRRETGESFDICWNRARTLDPSITRAEWFSAAEEKDEHELEAFYTWLTNLRRVNGSYRDAFKVLRTVRPQNLQAVDDAMGRQAGLRVAGVDPREDATDRMMLTVELGLSKGLTFCEAFGRVNPADFNASVSLNQSSGNLLVRGGH